MGGQEHPQHPLLTKKKKLKKHMTGRLSRFKATNADPNRLFRAGTKQARDPHFTNTRRSRLRANATQVGSYENFESARCCSHVFLCGLSLRLNLLGAGRQLQHRTARADQHTPIHTGGWTSQPCLAGNVGRSFTQLYHLRSDQNCEARSRTHTPSKVPTFLVNQYASATVLKF